jgi:hypothetical protein
MLNTLALRIICTDPPLTEVNGRPALFGVQDKAGDLMQGHPTADNALQFDISLTVSGDDPARLSGKQVHGTPAERFIYLSYRYADTPGEWIKRIKVPLKTITADQVRALQEHASQVLATTVDGRRSATVAAVWEIVPSP